MAILSNGRHGAGYLAVEVTIDKRFEISQPFSRGAVTSWENSPEVQESLADLHKELVEELGLELPDWPPIEKDKVGWLNCTIKFFVGQQIIYQQGLMVQYYTFWEWFHSINDLTKTEHEEPRTIYSGWESPELRLHLVREPYDPDWLEDDSPRYGYSLSAYVDIGINAGEGTVSGEGPGIFLYPSEAGILAFAHQLWQEADQAG